MWKARWDEGQVGCQRALIIFQGLARSWQYEGDLSGFRRGGECWQIFEGIPTRFRLIWFLNRELLAAAVPRQEHLHSSFPGHSLARESAPVAPRDSPALAWLLSCWKAKKTLSISCVLNHPENHPSHSISFLLYVVLGEERNYRGKELNETFSSKH